MVTPAAKTINNITKKIIKRTIGVDVKQPWPFDEVLLCSLVNSGRYDVIPVITETTF
jgi:hypothetical protein